MKLNLRAYSLFTKNNVCSRTAVQKNDPKACISVSFVRSFWANFYEVSSYNAFILPVEPKFKIEKTRGLVSNGTALLRRWGSESQKKFGFIS